ncbi:MAG TPA: hypothetical protein VNG33_00865 [Polyangiaceae bacterium]|nr:hypothetical protein [Polyangiaceae bacterium]
MKGSLISSCFAFACTLALGCDPRGVSLGSEEQCVLDARFAAVTVNPKHEPLSNCAELGDNLLLNSGFETPVVGACQGGFFCEFPAADVDGWDTTGEAQVIEIWHDGYHDVPAPDGSQFAELDAMSQDTLSQDVALSPGQLMYWSLLHRGRNGIESVEVRIGPPDATVSQGIFSSTNDAWYAYSGVYRVGTAETLTRFALVSRTGTLEGNLVDNIVFAPVQ